MSSIPETQRARRLVYRGDLVPVAVIVLVTFLAFLPALGAGFVSWDDNRNFLGNEAYRGLGLAQLEWMWSTALMGHYIPVSWMTLGLDFTLWGMDGRGYHFTNLVLHCAAAVLLYFVALRLFRAGAPGHSAGELRLPVAAAVLVFAVHPLRAESVAWITERRDMLSLAFALASVLCYLRWAGEGRRRWYVASLLAFAAALLSKASVVTLPAVLAVVNAYPLRRFDWRTLRELVPFFVLSLAAGLLSLFVLHPPAQLGLGDKLAVSAYSLCFYLMKTLVPSGLSPLYEMPKHIDATEWRYVASFIASLGLLWLAAAVRRRWPAVAATLLASGLVILPLLGVVQNGPQIAADRYTYHAAAALSLLVAIALVRWPGRGPTALTGLAILVLSALTWRQTGYWKDSESLWSRVLAVDSASSVAQFAMGDLRREQGRSQEALQHYERAVALDPAYAEGHNNLGVLLAQQGRGAEALPHYARALALEPDYPAAHLNWGVALASTGQPAASLEHFQLALSQSPTLPNAHLGLGNAVLRLGRAADAIAHYAEELRLHPDNADAHLNWGVALAQSREFGAAAAHFSEALRLKPDLHEARVYLAQAERLKSPQGGGASHPATSSADRGRPHVAH